MKNYFRIILRNLVKNPTFGFVTIVGFAFSFAIALLLASYIFNEFSYDKSYPKIDRIYRLCTKNQVTTFKGELTEELKNRYPEIEHLCRYDFGAINIAFNKTPFSVDELVKTDIDFFSVFSVKS